MIDASKKSSTAEYGRDLLAKAEALEEDANQFGFRWDTVTQIMDQINSEWLEVKQHFEPQYYGSQQSTLQEEIGDLLHAVLSLCFYCKFSARETLEESLVKFESRLHSVKQVARQRGLTTLENASFDERMAIWDKAKRCVEKVNKS